MLKTIFFVGIFPFMCFAQKNHLLYSSSVLIPIRQTALSYHPKSGELQFSTSSYFKGFNYEFDFKDSTWGIKVGTVMGRENYTITNYNSFIDNYPSSPYLPIFTGKPAQIKSAIFSLDIQNSYYFNKGKDVLSWNAGIYCNLSQQLDYLFDINVKLVRSVDFAEYYTKITVPTIQKKPLGFDLGISLRKILFNRLIVDLSAQYLPRNIFIYTYQTYNTMNISDNGGYFEYTSSVEEKEFRYGLLKFQLNLGLRF